METISYALPQFRYPRDQAMQNVSKDIYQEVVEISSDEDEDMDDGQPESSQRKTQPSPHCKRTVVIDSDDENSGTQLDMLYHFLEPPPMKRPKLDHVEYANDLIQEQLAFADLIDFSTWDLPESNFFEADRLLTNRDIPSDEPEQNVETPALALRSVSKPEPAIEQTSTPSNVKASQDSICQPHKRMKTKGKGKPRLQNCPYYYDLKFETRMYCGPGFETFPVVLDSYPEYQEVCDEWDRQQARIGSLGRRRHSRRSEVAQYIHDVASSSSSEEEDDVDDLTQGLSELDCLHKIREVLPDIQRDFALARIQEHLSSLHSHVDGDIEIRPDPAVIVSQILESSEYPKREKSKRSKEPAPDGTGVTIEWQTGQNDSRLYQQDAVCLLAAQFDRVPTHFIHKTMQEKQSLFESYLHIDNLNVKYESLPTKDRPYRRVLHPRVSLEKKYVPKAHGTRLKMQWESLVNELQAAKQQVERNRLRAAREQKEQAAEEANLQEHKASGNLVECQCCFDDEVPMNRAVSCEDKEMHWFCFGCVLRLAENQIGSMKHEMTCMHQSECKAALSKDGVIRAVPKTISDKLAFHQQQHEITAACIDGLEQCPFCDFKAICDSIEESSVFQCQNPDCLRVSCRKCHEDSHLPRSCEEVKRDRRLSARHQVEEARSEAMMRACPKCKVKIIKEMGCNKMKCGRCGCIMCYVCKADISSRKDGGYSHFNETGAKCILYDKGFDRHEMDADEAEAVAIKKVQAEHADIDVQQLQIETGKTKRKEVDAPVVMVAPALLRGPGELNHGWNRAHRPRLPAQGRLPHAHQFRFEQMYQQGLKREDQRLRPVFEHKNDTFDARLAQQLAFDANGVDFNEHVQPQHQIEVKEAAPRPRNLAERAPSPTLTIRSLAAPVPPNMMAPPIPARRVQFPDVNTWLYGNLQQHAGHEGEIWTNAAPIVPFAAAAADGAEFQGQQNPPRLQNVEKGKGRSIGPHVAPDQEQNDMDAREFVGNLFAPWNGIDFNFAPAEVHPYASGAAGQGTKMHAWEPLDVGDMGIEFAAAMNAKWT